MKKLIALAIVLLAAGSVFAANINLGNFPLGQWEDPNYDADWEFSSNNIRILSKTDGSVLWDFSTLTLDNFKVFLDGTQPAMSFSCDQTGRAYTFTKPLTDSDLVLKIDRTGKSQYSVNMKKK